MLNAADIFAGYDTIIILDQADMLGGAEHYSLALAHKRHEAGQTVVIIGGKNPQYQSKLTDTITRVDFHWPSLQGSLWQKIIAIPALLLAAWRLKQCLQRISNSHIHHPLLVSNTPRTHLVVWLAKQLRWISLDWMPIFHDFTVRPSWLLKKILHTATKNIAVSEPLKKHLQSTAHLPSATFCLMPNTLDLSTVPVCAPPSEFHTIVHLGRIDPRKGQSYTLEAADLLLERNPELRFEIIGDSTPTDPRTVAYETTLKTFAADRSLNNVTFKTGTSSPWEALASADIVLVVPTEPESFGRIVIEALALNKLVLAFDQTGPREILQQYLTFVSEKSGESFSTHPLLIEPGNAMSLSETIAEYADRPAQTKILTQYGRAFVETFYAN